MTSEDVKSMAQVAKVMAKTVAVATRLEAMKAANTERQSDGLALAYDEAAFNTVEDELIQYVTEAIGS